MVGRRICPILSGAVLLAVLVIPAIFADALSPHAPHFVNPEREFLPPAWMDGGVSAHPLGTHWMGRDVLSRLIYGSRTILYIAALAIGSSAIVGIPIGLALGHLGFYPSARMMQILRIMRWIVLGYLLVSLLGIPIVLILIGLLGILFALISRGVTDLFVGVIILLTVVIVVAVVIVISRRAIWAVLVEPWNWLLSRILRPVGLAMLIMLLAIIGMSILGQSMGNVVIVIAVMLCIEYIRLAWVAYRAVQNTGSADKPADAGEAVSAERPRLPFRYAAPGTLARIAPSAMAHVAFVIALESALSFIGLGIPPNEPSWGRMLAGGIRSNISDWWTIAFPSMAIVLATAGAMGLSKWLKNAVAA